MLKIDCNKGRPMGDGDHVVTGKDETELLKNVATHAVNHGMTPSPEMLELTKHVIEKE